eukprot:210265-Pelagomonas_calceolata.AAC.14
MQRCAVAVWTPPYPPLGVTEKVAESSIEFWRLPRFKQARCFKALGCNGQYVDWPCRMPNMCSQAIAAKNAEFEAAIKAADTPYMKDVLAKKQECEWRELVRWGVCMCV